MTAVLKPKTSWPIIVELPVYEQSSPWNTAINCGVTVVDVNAVDTIVDVVDVVKVVEVEVVTAWAVIVVIGNTIVVYAVGVVTIQEHACERRDSSNLVRTGLSNEYKYRMYRLVYSMLVCTYLYILRMEPLGRW